MTSSWLYSFEPIPMTPELRALIDGALVEVPVESQKDEMRAMRRDGVLLREIAQRFGISTTYTRRIVGPRR